MRTITVFVWSWFPKLSISLGCWCVLLRWQMHFILLRCFDIKFKRLFILIFRNSNPWRSILMCNKSSSDGTSLEGTSMFAHITLHRTLNLLARWGSSFLRTITFLIIHRFLSLKVLFSIYLLFKKHYKQYISIWKIVLDLVKGTCHHNFMAGCGSLLWVNTCSRWSGIKS